MSALGSVNQLDPSMTAPWTVPSPLADVPEGETNLLHRSAWSDPVKPLRVQFKPWYGVPLPVPTPPDPPFTETVQVFLDDDENDIVVSRTWTLPMDPDDHFIEISANHLPQGEHTFNFILTNYVGVRARSYPYTVTIDKDAPLLNASSKLIFPPEVLPPNKLTADYLVPEDKLEVAVPAYLTPKVGDAITWFWDKTSSGTTIGGTKVLTAQDYDKPLSILIEGEWIRSQGDGDRYAWYSVTDRAGNPPNGQSAVVGLDVAAQPVPRHLPPPKVAEASGANWPAAGTLTPTNALDGVKVLLNPLSTIHPGEKPQVQWAVKGELGAWLADPISDDNWEYKIPKEYMAPHFGKVIPVVYLFDDKLGNPHQSNPYTLTVLNFPKDRLHAPASADGSPLSLALVPAAGASVTLRTWPFSAARQRITIMVEGIEDSSGKTIAQVVLDKHEVTQGQAEAGIARGEALIAKDFLTRIRLASQLTVKAYVSFDNGQTWEGQPSLNPAVAQFPWLKVTLIQ